MSTDEAYKRKMNEFGFKPYGKTKGKFKITYNVYGVPQTEIWESMEMAMGAAKRYSKIDEFSDVKIFDESDKQIKMEKKVAKYSIGDFVKTSQLKFTSGVREGQIQYPSIEGEIVDIEPFQNDYVYTLISSTKDGVKQMHKVSEIQIVDETSRPYADGGGVDDDDDEYYEEEVEEVEEEEKMCSMCSGTGEGSYDGSSCRSCGGSGIDNTKQKQAYRDWLYDNYADGGMMAKGGHVSKGELVWRKLSSSDKINFLYENFTPEITPRSQELLVGKAFNFLPKKVKLRLEAKYANLEDFADGGMTIKGRNSDGSYNSKRLINYKFKVGDVIKVPQYLSSGKLGKIQAEIVETIAAKQNDGTYYPFYYVVLDGDTTKMMYDEEKILEYGNKSTMTKPKKRKRFEVGGYTDDNFEIVVVSKETSELYHSYGGRLIKDRFFISAENEQEAKNKAVEMWEKDMYNKDLHIVNVMTDSEYRVRGDGGMMAKGGSVDKYNVHFNYNPSNLKNKDAEKIVNKYTKDWKHDNDFDEVSFHVMGLSKSDAKMLVKELKMEDTYNFDIEESKYSDGGMMARGGMMADGGMVGKSFTIREMKDYLNDLFPDSFQFALYPLKEGTSNTPDYDVLGEGKYFEGLNEQDLNGEKLYFGQYKRDHSINFDIHQGAENTYFEFLLGSRNALGQYRKSYVGTFGFKDDGNVSSDYITRFLAFLMEQYGLPFQVNHSVMAKGGKIVRTQFEDEEFEFADGGMMAKGGGIGEVDMDKVESEAQYAASPTGKSTKPTIEKFEKQIKEYELLKNKLENKQITPSKIIGSGFKYHLARPLAFKWLKEQILISERAIEILENK